MHHWFQWLAALLLTVAFATGLRFRSKPVRNYFGWTRFFDAAAWTILLWYGNYFN